MADVAIITDSTANIPEDLVERYTLEIAPQVLIWDGEELLDEIDISPTQFYERLEGSDSLPTTSQATVAFFRNLFEPHVAAGRPIVAILISSDLSGTVQSALQAKDFFPDARIEVIDSRSVAMGLGFQALAAARAAENGNSLEEILLITEKARQNSGVLFAVDTLEYLHKGGRIGGASRLLGTALHLKPLLHVYEGRVEALEKIRTKAKAVDRLLDLVDERVQGKDNVRVASMHAACLTEAEHLLERVKSRCTAQEYVMTQVGPVLGTHTGPGTVGLAYCTDV